MHFESEIISMRIYLNSPIRRSSIPFICFYLHKLTKQQHIEDVLGHSFFISIIEQQNLSYVFRYILKGVINCIQRIYFGNLHQRTIWQPKTLSSTSEQATSQPFKFDRNLSITSYTRDSSNFPRRRLVSKIFSAYVRSFPVSNPMI